MDAATMPDTDELLPPVAYTVWDMKYRFKERDGTPTEPAMDNTRLRVARALPATEKGRRDQALGRSRGRLTTKILIACDALGQPLRMVLSPVRPTPGPTRWDTA